VINVIRFWITLIVIESEWRLIEISKEGWTVGLRVLGRNLEMPR